MAQTMDAVLSYYKNVNEAELAICDSNFAKANSYYAAAFAINSKKAFYKDLENAFFSAMDSREYGLAEKYMSQLMRRGLDSESVSHIKRVCRGEQLAQVNALMAKYPNYMAILKNEPLVKELRHMVEWDQGVRFYYSAVMQLSDYMTDSTFKVDAINAQHLLKILKEKGIPSEAVLKETGYSIIILHNKGAGYGGYTDHLFDTILSNGVLHFDYDARSFTMIFDENLSKPFTFGNTVLHGALLSVWGASYQNKIYGNVYDDSSETRINRERAKIGLPSLADFRRKLDAYNEGLDTNSVLHKYLFNPEMTVIAFDNGERLKEWLLTKGKDAPVKRAYLFKTPDQIMQTGRVNGMMIGQLTFDSAVNVYKKWWGYNQGQVYFGNWKHGRPPLPWNYHAEVIENPHEKLATDIGRANKALFVPGYKFVVEGGWEGPIKLDNLHLTFGTDSKLIYLKADVGLNFNMVATYYCGKADSVKTSYDTRYWQNNKRYKITLTTKRYVWQRGSTKTVVTVKDELNDRGDKKTTRATYEMMDAVKYNAYLQEVAAEKKRLDMAYAGVKGQ